MKLFNFIFNVLSSKLNNPSSNIFLPKSLSEIKTDQGEKYLPLKISSLNIDNFPENNFISKAFGTAWGDAYLEQLISLSVEKPTSRYTQLMIDEAIALFNKIKQHELIIIAHPNSPPIIEMSNLIIDGLSNIKLDSSIQSIMEVEGGYHCIISLDFNSYTPMSGIDWSKNLMLNGFNLKVKQQLCFASVNDQSYCEPFPKETESSVSLLNEKNSLKQINSLLNVNISNTSLLADVMITVSNALNIKINKLNLKGKNKEKNPTYQLEKFTFGENELNNLDEVTWKPFIKNLLNTDKVASSITTNINAAFNSDENKKIISLMLNEKINGVLNIVFGLPKSDFSALAPQGSNTNIVDQYIYSRVIYALNDSSSQLYLQKMIKNMKSPVLEPYKTNIDIIEKTFLMEREDIKYTISKLTLGEVNVIGISNLTAPSRDITFDINTTNAILYSIQPMVVESTFSFMAAINANSAVGPFLGKIQIKMGAANDYLMNTKFLTSGTDIESLIVTFNNLSFIILPDKMNTTVQFEKNNLFGSIVTKFFNNDEFKRTILSALNSLFLNQLSNISDQVTLQMKKIGNEFI